MSSHDEWIGRQVARHRDLADLTQQQVADAMGWTQAYLSMIERGKRPITKRDSLLRLADILRIPNHVLLGIPLPAWNKDDLITLSAVSAIRAALDYPDEPVVPRPQHELELLTKAVLSARMACDYTVIGAGLPSLLAETRAAYEAGHRWAGGLLVRGLVAGSLTLRPIGWQDLAMRLADLARRVATELATPDDMGAAEFAYAQGVLASGSRRRSMDLATASADRLASGEPSARMWRGMLNLQAALSASSLGDAARAASHFDEAASLAQRPHRDSWLMEFTPANVITWRVAGALEIPDNGDAERAPELAAQVPPRALRTKQRISRLDMDAGRGFYLSGRPDAAIQAFRRAYAVAPSETRSRSSVREIVGQMARDARGGGSSDLRELVDAMGLAA